MRPEYVFAASLVIAALALPAGLILATGNMLPGFGAGGGAARPEPAAGRESAPLTLVTAPIVVPADVAAGYRSVVATIELPGLAAADAACRHHARLADRVQLYLQDNAAPPAADSGHDARLAWLIERTLPPDVATAAGVPAEDLVDGAALVPATALSAREHARPLYACTGAQAHRLAGR